MVRFVVEESEAGERADRVVRSRFPGVDRASALSLLKAGRILVDGAAARLATRLTKGQQVDVEVAAGKLGKAAPTVDVLFEGEGIVVVSKPEGLAMHAGPGVPDDEETLHRMLRGRYPIEVGFAGPSFLGRLDRPTSGLVVSLLARGALAAIEPLWKVGRLQKEYLVVVHGETVRDRVIDMPLAARRPQHRGTGKREEARTEMLTLASTKRASLVLVEPKTGRTHQVRRHMKAIGHQVIGDTRYGDANKDARLLGDEDGLGLMLHAWRYRHGGDVPLLPRDVVARCPERIREVCAGVGIDADAVLGDLLAQPLPVR